MNPHIDVEDFPLTVPTDTMRLPKWVLLPSPSMCDMLSEGMCMVSRAAIEWWSRQAGCIPFDCWLVLLRLWRCAALLSQSSEMPLLRLLMSWMLAWLVSMRSHRWSARCSCGAQAQTHTASSRSPTVLQLILSLFQRIGVVELHVLQSHDLNRSMKERRLLKSKMN